VVAGPKFRRATQGSRSPNPTTTTSLMHCTHFAA
jgi:hypothetical protein